MLDELKPRGLHMAAHELGLDPFAVVGLLVAADAVPAGALRLDDVLISRLREVGEIPSVSWWDDVVVGDGAKARVQAAVKMLLDRGFVGEAGTRADNLWRGLDDDDQVLLQAATMALAEDGVVTLEPTPVGLGIVVSEDQKKAAAAFAAGTGSSPALDAVLEG